MKIELKRDGELIVRPENDVEAYALEKWLSEYKKRVHVDKLASDKDARLNVMHDEKNPIEGKNVTLSGTTVHSQNNGGTLFFPVYSNGTGAAPAGGAYTIYAAKST